MSYQSDKDEAYKALSKKDRAKLFRNLSNYERTTDLVTFHSDTMSVSEMAAYVEFASHLARTRNGVVFAGNAVKRDKTWKELKATVTDKAYYAR